MTEIFPSAKPTSQFRASLEKRVIAEFTSAQTRHTSATSWFKWLIPAISFAAVVLMIGLPYVKKTQEAGTVAKLDQEMNTLEKQLLQDPELDAAINFQEI